MMEKKTNLYPETQEKAPGIEILLETNVVKSIILVYNRCRRGRTSLQRKLWVKGKNVINCNQGKYGE